MRKTRIAPGEHYHIFNRGMHKQNTFLSDKDRNRFLIYIFLFQFKGNIRNIDRLFSVQHSVLHIPDKYIEGVKEEDRLVRLHAFCLMPNHFHLIVSEVKEGGIATYMQRIQNAYTKYFNMKHQKSGHLFQGSYKSVHIESNEQLLYLSAYIHRNPIELGLNSSIYEYPWSSLSDFLDENRWKVFLDTSIILSQFGNSAEYKKFIETHTAKDPDFEKANGF